jgi:exodeoxyribonuclease VII large subunit
VKLLRPAEALRRQAGVLDMQAHRLAAAAQRVLTAARQNLQGRAAGLQRANQHSLQVAGRRLDRLGDRLCGLDPQVVLRRGYAWLTDVDARPLTSVGQLAVGQNVRAVLADGQIEAHVTGVVKGD